MTFNCFYSLPEHVTTIITLILSLLVFLLTTLTTEGCQFIRMQIKGTVNLRYIGMFSTFVENQGCKVLVWPNGKVPGPVRASQAFGVMTPMLAGFALVMCLFQICSKAPTNFFRCIGIMYGVCFVFQMLTFTIFAIEDCKKSSNFMCEPGPTGYTSLMAAVFFLASSIVFCMVPATDRSLIRTIIIAMNEGPDAVNVPKGRDAVNVPKGPTTTTTAKTSNDGDETKYPIIIREVENECIDQEGNKTITKVTEQMESATVKKSITETTQPDGSIIVSTDITEV